ncbi:MAG TPA: methyltransferase domain-containing protein [Candidatus Thermoplasmatota archaeon]|nr:methyltransferase domain-containing protein [Candidatus Thermoplasmatota archaeon]
MVDGASFQEKYSSLYDLIYAKKDYEAEADFVLSRFRAAGARPERVLEVGCGSGGHALPLLRRGVRVTGVDLSAAMVRRAREKAAAAGLPGDFHVGDVRSARVPGAPFDAAISMFAVLGYLTTDDDLLAGLRNVRAHLRDGGLLQFDAWNGLAVAAQGPERRVAVFEDGARTLERVATPTLDPEAQVCTVRYDLTVRWSGGEDRFVEHHPMRYFFPRELALLLRAAGFRLVDLRAFPGGGPLTPRDWSVSVLARAE